jgi:hypothetical protein
VYHAPRLYRAARADWPSADRRTTAVDHGGPRPSAARGYRRLPRLFEDAPVLYAITQLTHEPKDFSASEIKREIQRGTQLCPLYTLAKRVVPALQISTESIKYYTSLVSYYSVYKLKRRPAWTAYLYLLCFVGRHR